MIVISYMQNKEEEKNRKDIEILKKRNRKA
jgi:hypothetical protein